MEFVIAIFLAAVGVTLLVGGSRIYRKLMVRAAEMSRPEPQSPAEGEGATGEVAPDGLVYLFGHEFAREKPSRVGALSRDKAHAPLTEVELDPEDWALQILYAALADVHMDSCLDCRVVERTPTFMPPFP